jgi:hypothetical protein
MTTFSASDTALEGFQVLRRHWRVAAGWALFYLVSAVAAVMASAVIGVILVLTGAARQEALQAIVGPLLAILVLWAAPLILVCGVYRLLLRPEAPGFLHLRVGSDELRMLAVWLVLGVAIGLGGYLIAAVLGALSGVASLWVRIPLGVAGGVVLALAVVRLGLAQAVAFADRRLDFGHALRLGRGRSWALFGTSVIVASLIGVVFVATWVGLFLLGGALTGFSDLSLSDAESLETHPGRYLLQFAAELVLTPVFLVLAHAPVAAAYKALSAAEPAAA